MIAAASRHVVHLYGRDEPALVRNVSEYLREAIERGGRSLAVVTPTHRAALIAELRIRGVDVDAAFASGALQMLDATWGLQSFLVNGYPDAQRFFAGIGARVRKLTDNGRRVRIYGEMVGLLWLAQQYPAAVRLEQLWNRLMRSVEFELYCGYPIDVFESEFRSAVVGGLLEAHPDLIGNDETGTLGCAVDRAVEEQSPAVRCPRLSSPEAKILWLRDHAPRYAETVIARARRYYAEAPRLRGRTTQISVP